MVEAVTFSLLLRNISWLVRAYHLISVLVNSTIKSIYIMFVVSHVKIVTHLYLGEFQDTSFNDEVIKRFSCLLRHLFNLCSTPLTAGDGDRNVQSYTFQIMVKIGDYLVLCLPDLKMNCIHFLNQIKV